MDRDDILLIMTACELLGKSVKPAEIERAFEKVKTRLDRLDLPPREAKISYARRRDEME